MTVHISTRINRAVRQSDDDTTPYLTWQPKGELNFEKVRRAAAYLSDLEKNYPQDFNRLIDLREVTSVDLYYEDLKRIADLRKGAIINCFVRCAVIAKDDLSYGMARMYDALLEHPSIEVGLFRDGEDAIEWLTSSHEIYAERLVNA